MAAIRSIIICGLFFILGIEFSSGQNHGERGCVVRAAQSQLGVTELTGKNDGVQVEWYLHYVGLKKGNPWCSAFLCWCYVQDDQLNPKNGLAASWFWDKSKIVYDRRYPKQTKPIHAGNVAGFYFDDLKGIHHVAMIEIWTGQWVFTIGGNQLDNTIAQDPSGGRVCRKKVLRKQVYQVASYN